MEVLCSVLLVSELDLLLFAEAHLVFGLDRKQDLHFDIYGWMCLYLIKVKLYILVNTKLTAAR